MSTGESKKALLARLGRNEDWHVAGHDFRQIFADFYPRVFRFFVLHGAGEENSRDLAQETMLRVYRSLSSFSGEAQLGTWVFQLTANVWKNEIRSRARQKRDAPEISLDELSGTSAMLDPWEEGEDPLVSLLVSEREEILREAMSALPPQMRRCVELRVFQDLKYREIAVLMDVSIETVKAHLFQARQSLRSKLSDYFMGPDL
jgi:RNA polymerase sigma-70 factor (ECF subfamily)